MYYAVTYADTLQTLCTYLFFLFIFNKKIKLGLVGGLAIASKRSAVLRGRPCFSGGTPTTLDTKPTAIPRRPQTTCRSTTTRLDTG